MTTWNERRFVVPGKCLLGIPAGGAGTAGNAAGQPGQPLAGYPPVELPLGEGVVLLRSLTLGAPAGPAAVGAPAAADRPGSVGAPAATDGPFAVHSSGVVDGPAGSSAGIGQAPNAEAVPADPVEPGEDSHGPAEAADPAADAVDVQPPVVMLDPVPALHHLDPEATIAPGAIIDVDGELVEEDGAVESIGTEVPGAELPDPVAAGAGSPAAGPTAAAANHAEEAPAVEMTTSYDHLWDRTVMRNIEDAAVREDPDADSGHVMPQQQPALPAAEPLAALGTAEDLAADGPAAGSKAAEAGAAEDGPMGHSGPGAGADHDAAVPPRAASTGVLIDSVPWRTGGAAPGPAPAPGIGSNAPGREPAAVHGPAPAYEPAPVHNQAPSNPQDHNPVPGQEAAGFDPDHDGQTVMKSSLAGSAAGPAANATAARQDSAGGPLVLARVCAQGHANPPTRAQCSACGAALLPDAVQVARPRLGRMRLSTGDLLDLDQSMVIGRQPSVSRVQGGVMPRLVQVASPGGDISRSHVEVRLEGWHVMLCDLKATNGTVLVREGQPPRRLAQNEMAILLDGDIAEPGRQHLTAF
ncbi:hypothetical protein NG819_18315 [Pseudarthrobacter sp. Fe7]|nr:hypothetical protein NG819_18315 [Pseudarthrobacter sp. Fe7]